MPNWSPTVLPQAAPRPDYSNLARGINMGAQTLMEALNARKQRQRQAMIDQRDESRYRDTQTRQVAQDALSAKLAESTLATHNLQQEAAASDLGYVPTGTTTAERLRPVAAAPAAGLGGAAGMTATAGQQALTSLQSALDATPAPTRTINGQSVVRDPLMTRDARDEQRAVRMANTQFTNQRSLQSDSFAHDDASQGKSQTFTAGENAKNRAHGTGMALLSRNAPQLVASADGYVSVDPTTGRAVPVTTGDGRSVMKPAPSNPGTQVPTSMVDATSTNYDLLTSIDEALDALEAGGGKGHIGGKRYVLPNIVSQHTDPAGNEIRGRIAGISNKQYKNMSGSAVSLAEDKRMQPDLPRVDDTPEAARAKLERLRSSIAREDGMIRQYYSEQNGYRGLPPARPDRDATRAEALTAIKNGADPAAVKARYKQMTGKELN